MELIKKDNFPTSEKVLPRTAVIQDMSGFGKVSLTEAIPVMSAMGVEVCPLPTAILSTHTYEFTNYTMLDLTDEMEKIINHWEEIGLTFDAVYSGYMSCERQIEITKSFMKKQKSAGAITVVDPVMGDNALLDVKTVYSDRMLQLISGMRELCTVADVITPNLTEACLLLNAEYPTKPLDDNEIKDILKRLEGIGAASSAITSVMDTESSMCVAVYDGHDFYKIDCGYIPTRPFHGTGDIFTSVLTGALVKGLSVLDASNLAVDFICEAIKKTMEYDIPIRNGVLFEDVLSKGFFARDAYKNRITVI